MPITVAQGLRIGNREPVDDRIIYETVFDALENSETRISPARRYDGLCVYIREEQRNYRFVGGTTDAHFVPDPASGVAGSSSGTCEGGSGILAIPHDYWFNTLQDRDDYFNINPDELKDELQVAVKSATSGFWYITAYHVTDDTTDPVTGEWVDMIAIARGENGEDGIDGLDGTGVVVVEDFNHLPAPGTEDTLYLVKDINTLYRWDSALTPPDYVSVGGGGSGTAEEWNFAPL